MSRSIIPAALTLFAVIATTGSAAPQNQPTSVEPGLFDVGGAFKLTSTRNGAVMRVLFPLPLSYREQVPLTYVLYTAPAGKLKSARIYRDRLDNYVADVTVGPLERNESINLGWYAVVLIGHRPLDSVSDKVPFPRKWPKETRIWLKSTDYVQSGHRRIKQVARQIRSSCTDRKDILSVIEATLARMKKIRAEQKPSFVAYDALRALDNRGSSVSNANLAAALLRANGIPTRIVAGYATWYGPQYHTQCIVEAHLPEHGWYAIESTMLALQWQPCKQIAVSIVPTEYENETGERDYVVAGIPYLSLTEFPDYSGACTVQGNMGGNKYTYHHARQRLTFPSAAIDPNCKNAIRWAKVRWQAWLDSPPTLDTSTGKLSTVPLPGLKTVKDPAGLVAILIKRDSAKDKESGKNN